MKVEMCGMANCLIAWFLFLPVWKLAVSVNPIHLKQLQRNIIVFQVPRLLEVTWGEADFVQIRLFARTSTPLDTRD